MAALNPSGARRACMALPRRLPQRRIRDAAAPRSMAKRSSSGPCSSNPTPSPQPPARCTAKRTAPCVIASSIGIGNRSATSSASFWSSIQIGAVRRPALQNRVQFQAGHPCRRRLRLSLLDASHGRPASPLWQSTPAPPIPTRSRPSAPKDWRVSRPHPVGLDRPRPFANPCVALHRRRLAALRFVVAHHPPLKSALGTGRRYGAPP